MLSLLKKETRNSRTKLTNNEIEKIFYPLTAGTFYEGDKKSYVIGQITPSRLQRLSGRKTKYFVLEIDNNNNDKYRVLRRTHDEKEAIFTMHNRVTFELLAKDFKALRRKKSSKNATMDRTVRRSSNRAKDDVVLKVIWSCNLKPNDTDNDSVWQAKRSLASVRPSDLKVVIYPEHYKVG